MSSRSALFDPCWLIDTGKGLGWQWIAQGTIWCEATVVQASQFVSCQAAALQTEGGKLLAYDFCSQVELLLRFFQSLCPASLPLCCQREEDQPERVASCHFLDLTE